MMKEISSKENRIFKECQRLSQKKYRDKEGRYLIEGDNLIGEAIKYRADIEYIILCDEVDFHLPANDNAVMMPEIYQMPAKLFDKIAQTETSQGMMAVIKKKIYSQDDLAEKCGNDENVLVLDRLQDPGNIGTVIRTAEGAGYAAVIALKGTADIYSPKTIRAGAGSVFRIPIIHVEDNREIRKLVDHLDKKLVVTCFDTDNYYFDTDLSKDIALVIGNEGNGVSEELIDMADIKIKIPMEGSLESLNASVAAGILMYEAQRCKMRGKNV